MQRLCFPIIYNSVLPKDCLRLWKYQCDAFIILHLYQYDSLLCLLWVAVSGKPSLSVLSSVSMLLCWGCELAKLSVIGSSLYFLLSTRVCLPEHKINHRLKFIMIKKYSYHSTYSLRTYLSTDSFLTYFIKIFMPSFYPLLCTYVLSTRRAQNYIEANANIGRHYAKAMFSHHTTQAYQKIVWGCGNISVIRSLVCIRINMTHCYVYCGWLY